MTSIEMIERPKQIVEFKELDCGSVFAYDHKLYMKVNNASDNEMGYAVWMNKGILEGFQDEVKIEPLECNIQAWR